MAKSDTFEDIKASGLLIDGYTVLCDICSRPVHSKDAAHIGLRAWVHKKCAKAVLGRKLWWGDYRYPYERQPKERPLPWTEAIEYKPMTFEHLKDVKAFTESRLPDRRRKARRSKPIRQDSHPKEHNYPSREELQRCEGVIQGSNLNMMACGKKATMDYDYWTNEVVERHYFCSEKCRISWNKQKWGDKMPIHML